MKNNLKIKPMSIWLSLLFFEIPSIFFYVTIYYFWPYLLQSGISESNSYFIIMYMPFGVLLIASLFFFKIEGNTFSFKEIKERFRLKQMTKQDWFWTIIATIASILAWYALLFTQKWLASIPLFSPPNHLPSNANPLIEQQGVPKMFLGLELKGNWILLSVAFLGQLLNVIAEEFWWRG